MTENVKRGGKSFVAFTFLLSVLALGGSGYLYYTGIEYKHQLDLELNSLAFKDASNVKVNQDLIEKLQNSVNELNNRINQISANRIEVILSQLNQLINLANQELIMYHDLPGCITLLTNAKKILAANNDAVFIGLNLAIAGDLAKLNSLSMVDRVMLSGELDNLMNEVLNLHVATIPTTQINPSTNEKSKWSTFVDNIKDSLLGLVSVTNSDSAKVLLPKQEITLQDGIKVNLLSARIALLERDQANWVYSLNNVKTMLNQSFSNYTDVDKINNQLNTLLQTNIGNSNVSIDATLAQLVKLNNLQH